jgi:hypothetical protein
VSFDLTVDLTSLPGDLLSGWEHALAGQGFEVEICPDAELGSHRGFLPFRVDRVPTDLLGVGLRSPIVAGFEFSFIDDGDPDEDDPAAGHFAMLSSSADRTTADLALQYLCAAWLAEFTDGLYTDPQRDIEARGAEAMDAALAGIRDDVVHGDGSEDLTRHPFPGWRELGVVVPEDPSVPSSRRFRWWPGLRRR